VGRTVSGWGRTVSGWCVALDVHYPPAGGARGALVRSSEASFAVVCAERVTVLAEVAPYEPGRFFARELPVLRALLAGERDLDLVVVDGYVHLDPDGRPGLGAHVHAEFGVPVIGVAKTPFRAATQALPVRRGEATRPLYVTAAGLDAADAAVLVGRMAGPYRLPDALRRVDRLSRSGECAGGSTEPGEH